MTELESCLQAERLDCDDDQKIFDEEYNVWKKNVPFLYDCVLTQDLEWPSLTCQWFPDIARRPDDRHFSRHRLLLGTHTADNAPNFLIIANVHLPNTWRQFDRDDDFNPITKEYGGYGAHLSRSSSNSNGGCGAAAANPPNSAAPLLFSPAIRIPHPGEVNRARYCPQNPCVIASRPPSNHVLIWDYTKHPSAHQKLSTANRNAATSTILQSDVPTCNPDVSFSGGEICGEKERMADGADLCLIGQATEGYGLEWNANRAGQLATCDEAGRVCVWDVEAADTTPLVIFDVCCDDRSGNQSEVSVNVEDVAWQPNHPDLLLLCGGGGGGATAGGHIQLFDLRCQKTGNPGSPGKSGATEGENAQLRVNTNHEINCASWSPFQEFLFASAGGAALIGSPPDSWSCPISVWDLRMLRQRDKSQPLLQMRGHTADIYQLEWSPHSPNQIASASGDRRVIIFDILSGKNSNSATALDSQLESESNAQISTSSDNNIHFIHGGHTAKVSELSWNANKENTLASVSEDNIVQIWKTGE